MDRVVSISFVAAIAAVRIHEIENTLLHDLVRKRHIHVCLIQAVN
jgi:hypothetical protein